MTKSKTIEVEGYSFEVEYQYDYFKGVHTLPNGDPGYPDSDELEIESILLDGAEVMNLLEEHAWPLYSKILIKLGEEIGDEE